jgi:hypothetical protein
MVYYLFPPRMAARACPSPDIHNPGPDGARGRVECHPRLAP